MYLLRHRRCAAVAIAAVVVLAGLVVSTPAYAVTDSDAGLFEATNAERVRYGRPPLTHDPGLSSIARSWTAKMLKAGVVSHNPNLANEVRSQVIPTYRWLGDNVGNGSSVNQVQSLFLQSAPHRANILGDYNRLGIGVLRAENGQIWVTAIFLSAPAISSGAPSPIVDPHVAVVATTSWQIAAAQRGNDGSVLFRTRPYSENWQIESLGGAIVHTPAFAKGNNVLHVFAVGTDRALWHRTRRDGVWSTWLGLGGQLTSSPTAVARGSTFEVFARGTDGAVWSRVFDGTRLEPWRSLGGNTPHAPAAVTRAVNYWDVFVVGLDGQMWRRSKTGTDMTGWIPVGGQFTSAPGATAVPWDSSVAIGARGTDGIIWWRNSRPSDVWHPLKGSGSAPAMTIVSGGVTVVLAGTDGRTWQCSVWENSGDDYCGQIF